MSKSITQLFNESLKLLTEKRQENLSYTTSARKGGKLLSEDNAAITRIEVMLTNKELPGNLASVASKTARAIAEFKEVKKDADAVIEKGKEKLRPLFDELFDQADATLIRVIKTAAISVTMSRPSTRKSLDEKMLIEKLHELFKDSTEVIDKLVVECTKVKEVAESISVELNESVVKNTISAAYKAIKTLISKAVQSIKSLLLAIDKKLTIVEAKIDPEDLKAVEKALSKFDYYVDKHLNESFELDDEMTANLDMAGDALIDAINISKESDEVKHECLLEWKKEDKDDEKCKLVLTVDGNEFIVKLYPKN